jgi:hypothetical protein
LDALPDDELEAELEELDDVLDDELDDELDAGGKLARDDNKSPAGSAEPAFGDEGDENCGCGILDCPVLLDARSARNRRTSKLLERSTGLLSNASSSSSSSSSTYCSVRASICSSDIFETTRSNPC